MSWGSASGLLGKCSINYLIQLFVQYLTIFALILGNKNLLEVCEMWGYLIEHYRKKKCLVDGEHWPETDS